MTTSTKRITAPVTKDLKSLRRTALDAGFAVIGATDLAREQAQATMGKVQEAALDTQTRLTAQVDERVRLMQQLPGQTLERSLAATGQVSHRFDTLAGRGRAVTRRLRGHDVPETVVQHAESVVDQAQTVIDQAQDAVADAEPPRTPATRPVRATGKSTAAKTTTTRARRSTTSAKATTAK